MSFDSLVEAFFRNKHKVLQNSNGLKAFVSYSRNQRVIATDIRFNKPSNHHDFLAPETATYIKQRSKQLKRKRSKKKAALHRFRRYLKPPTLPKIKNYANNPHQQVIANKPSSCVSKSHSSIHNSSNCAARFPSF